MTSLKTSIKTITYLSDIGCLEIQGASLVGYCDEIDQILQSGITTKAFCGVLAILPIAAEVRQYPSSANTLNNSKHLVRWKTAPYIPALKDGVLRRTG